MGLDDILDSDDIDNMSDDTKAREIVEREISSTWDVIVQAETQKGHRYTDFDTDPDDPEVADDYENLVVSEVARIRRWIAEQV